MLLSLLRTCVRNILAVTSFSLFLSTTGQNGDAQSSFNVEVHSQHPWLQSSTNKWSRDPNCLLPPSARSLTRRRGADIPRCGCARCRRGQWVVLRDSWLPSGVGRKSSGGSARPRGSRARPGRGPVDPRLTPSRHQRGALAKGVCGPPGTRGPVGGPAPAAYLRLRPASCSSLHPRAG